MSIGKADWIIPAAAGLIGGALLGVLGYLDLLSKLPLLIPAVGVTVALVSVLVARCRVLWKSVVAVFLILLTAMVVLMPPLINDGRHGLIDMKRLVLMAMYLGLGAVLPGLLISILGTWLRNRSSHISAPGAS